ncbi:3',5'-cyclic-nucleotide phosphodiesterase [Methylobacterium sp. P1-11]|uniref:3',5'-cyclic-nucleotide phosphodiesterase n=1 Tax=Methylobacterium sp. P1-11 TaxID=2024616 RepID=UPI0011EFC506|nr:3',5'-cyclic-nucleotide phosphodiesterase [Methylobacterium sp. P1-11]KAA0123162.1 3',5'-cyclic-nucleotide phosphodiesterase [Methylobacterium sp. P1-11]
MRLKPIVLAVATAVVLTLPAAAQQTKRGNETLKKYCTGDYLTYCGNLAPDDPATDACFQKNWKKLSENCRRAIDAYEAEQEQNAPGKNRQGSQGARERRG